MKTRLIYYYITAIKGWFWVNFGNGGQNFWHFWAGKILKKRKEKWICLPPPLRVNFFGWSGLNDQLAKIWQELVQNIRGGVLVQLIILSLPNGDEVELGWGWPVTTFKGCTETSTTRLSQPVASKLFWGMRFVDYLGSSSKKIKNESMDFVQTFCW
jgi:hypothetical protein